jgi:hypothetical protein
MYMSRDIMHCKPGKAKELVAKFKEASDAMKKLGYPETRIYTDVSAENYWTVVMELELGNLDDFAKMARSTMTDPAISKALSGYHDLVINGRRELYQRE